MVPYCLCPSICPSGGARTSGGPLKTRVPEDPDPLTCHQTASHTSLARPGPDSPSLRVSGLFRHFMREHCTTHRHVQHGRGTSMAISEPRTFVHWGIRTMEGQMDT